ncbi:ribonuclease H-like domain-containing protein [Tanacetum coccineum]
MHQPPGFVDPNKPNYVCHLQRSLYGLKQAPRAWFQRFASYATRVGFQHSKTDSSLFVFHRGSDIAYLLLYVDDIILTASSSAFLQRIITSLHKSKLGSDGDPVSNPTLYRSLVGALQYLTFTRPDLSYAVQQVCLYMHDPRDPHFTALKRILRYVRGTLDYGLQLHVSFTTQLTAYTDADWAGCPVTRRSTSGYCVFLGDNLLSWSAKRQVTLSRSSAEAGYRGVANVVAETAWIRNLLCELHTPLFTATLVYCDNVSAVYMSANPVQHQRTKHIEIDIHFVRDFVASGQVRVLHVPSRFQYADIFTKGLPTALFIEFRSSLNVRRSPAHTEGGYEVEGYTKEIVQDYEQRHATIFGKQVNRVHILDFEGLTEEMRHGLPDRLRMVYTGAQGQLGRATRSMTWRQLILALGLHTAEEMAGDDGDFLGVVPSYTLIRDPLRRLCHRLISFIISGRAQAPEKVTTTDLFYLRSMDEGWFVTRTE